MSQARQTRQVQPVTVRWQVQPSDLMQSIGRESATLEQLAIPSLPVLRHQTHCEQLRDIYTPWRTIVPRKTTSFSALRVSKLTIPTASTNMSSSTPPRCLPASRKSQRLARHPRHCLALPTSSAIDADPTTTTTCCARLNHTAKAS